MSKISLQPNASGTGTFTLAAPNSNTNRTLTLPDEAGVVLTDTSDIETQVKSATNATGDAPVYACRAWVNFDGTGTVTIRASGNVSSITDNGTGDYTVNFATAISDQNYTVTASASDLSAANFSRIRLNGFKILTLTTSGFTMLTGLSDRDEENIDFHQVLAAIFR